MEVLPYRPLWTFHFFISALMLEKLVRCLIVFMKLLELWVITKFEIDLEAATRDGKTEVKMSA